MIMSREEVRDMLETLTGVSNPSIVDLDDKVYAFYKEYILPFVNFMHNPYIMKLITVRGEDDFEDPDKECKFGADIDQWTVSDLLLHNGGVYPSHVWPGVPIRYRGERVSGCGHCVNMRGGESPMFTSFELVFNESAKCAYCGHYFDFVDSG